MSEFIVHSIPGSPFGRSVLATLEEKRAPYRLAPLAPGSLKTPEYLALHPFGRVPVLEHDGFRLYETQAILRYLDRVLPQPALTPSDVQARRAHGPGDERQRLVPVSRRRQCHHLPSRDRRRNCWD